MKERFVGIVAPLPWEGRAVLKRGRWRLLDGIPSLRGTLPDGGDVLLLSPGGGEERAKGAARALVARGAGALAVVGVCGGLHPQLREGDLIVAREILREGWCRTRGLEEVPGEGRVWRGGLVTVRAPVLTAAGKAELCRRTGALGVDLESAAVADVARGAGLPFLAARAVCDPPGRDVPLPLATLLSKEGKVRRGGLLFLLLRRPDLVPALWRLARDFAAARRRLSRALPVAGAVDGFSSVPFASPSAALPASSREHPLH